MTNDKRTIGIEIGKACIGGLLDTMTGSVILTASEVKEIERYIDQLNAENAKLREYVKLYVKAVKCDGCEWCPYDINLVCDVETMPMRDGCKLYDELRKLGIEVD